MVMLSPTATNMTNHSVQTKASPRHLRQRGEEACRPPVIEDEEHLTYPRCRNVQQENRPNLLLDDPSGEPSQSSSDSPGQMPENEKSPHQNEYDRSHMPEGFLRNLSWRQRIKHVSWAYFTLTMATGGIRFFPDG